MRKYEVYVYLQMNRDEAINGHLILEQEAYVQSNFIEINKRVIEIVPINTEMQSRNRFINLIAKLEKDDILIIRDFESLGASTKEAINEYKKLLQRNIRIIILDLPLINNWRLMHDDYIYLHTTELIIDLKEEVYRSEFDLRRRKNKDALNKAKAQGKKVGRPKGNVPKDFILAYEQYKHGSFMGLTLKQFCQFCHISKSCFYNWEKKINEQKNM